MKRGAADGRPARLRAPRGTCGRLPPPTQATQSRRARALSVHRRRLSRPRRPTAARAKAGAAARKRRFAPAASTSTARLRRIVRRDRARRDVKDVFRLRHDRAWDPHAGEDASAPSSSRTQAGPGACAPSTRARRSSRPRRSASDAPPRRTRTCASFPSARRPPNRVWRTRACVRTVRSCLSGTECRARCSTSRSRRGCARMGRITCAGARLATAASWRRRPRRARRPRRTPPRASPRSSSAASRRTCRPCSRRCLPPPRPSPRRATEAGGGGEENGPRVQQLRMHVARDAAHAPRAQRRAIAVQRVRPMVRAAGHHAAGGGWSGEPRRARAAGGSRPAGARTRGGNRGGARRRRTPGDETRARRRTANHRSRSACGRYPNGGPALGRRPVLRGGPRLALAVGGR